MKKNNLWRIIWVIGIYAILVLILYLVIMYKVKWEDKDLNTYLYFYNCSNNICTSTYKQDNYYSSLICKDNVCPFITKKNNNLLILSDGNKDFLYDYVSGKTINDSYTGYRIIKDNNFIVTKDGKEGIIDVENNIIVDLIYNEIIDYNNGYLVYKENNKYGIINNSNSINIIPKYDDVVLIDEKIFAYKENNKYYIASYNDELPINTTSYDYIYSNKEVIITFSENKVDILGLNLKSKLLMKLNSYYKYTIEKERESLNFYQNDNFLYFTIFVEENKFVNYIYDLKNNRLIY